MMASALALTGAAYAQEAPPAASSAECAPQPACATGAAGRIAFDAAFFAQYNPQTALDMVRQTPGFSLDGGDDRRGFSGAVGNLLIDGARPASKSQSLEGILSRIPANQVVRIEVLRGAEVAGDASGQAQLVNIVRTENAGSGVWEAGFESNAERLSPRGEASYSGRSGQIEYGLGASYFSQRRSLPGWREFYDGAGALTGTADATPLFNSFREGSLNGNVALPLAGGRLTANAQIEEGRFRSDAGFAFFDAGGAPDFSLSTLTQEQFGGAEIGANYDRDFGPWSMALIGLLNRRFFDSDEDGQFAGSVTSNYTQAIRQDTGETILRGSLSRALGDDHRIEFGGEGAFNSLDQTLRFVENAIPQPIPNSNALIEEERAEMFGSHTWRPTPNWTVETRVAWETSTLTFSGDHPQVVELSFWKPSVQIARSFAGNNQLRFRVYRDVGQLDFGDFVSAASVSDALINGGNPDLVPTTDWRAELGADLRFRGAALGLTLTRHQYRDVADLVKLTDTRGTPDPADDRFFDAPGNIGEAEATSLEVNFSSPVSFIPGGRLTIEGSLWDTKVTDPVTRQPRIISFRPESEISVTFRQDIAAWKFAWGVEAYKEGEVQAYRFNEIDTSEEGPWIDLWVETTALPHNMKLRLWAANAFDGTINRRRRFFGDLTDSNLNNDDRTGPFRRLDLRQRRFDGAPWAVVQLSGTF
jgi:hypothetical protein